MTPDGERTERGDDMSDDFLIAIPLAVVIALPLFMCELANAWDRHRKKGA